MSASAIGSASSSSISALSSAAVTASKGKTLDTAKATKIAKEFESVFVANAIKSMFEGVGEDPMLSGGSAGLQWRGMLIDEYAKSVEDHGGLGMAKPIADGLLRVQETASN